MSRKWELSPISRRLLDMRFKEIRGLPTKKAITVLRLEALRKLLRSSSDPISLICRKCGFGSDNHPKELFRLHYGRSRCANGGKTVAAAETV